MQRLRKVLVVGSGGREHALALRLLDSPSVEQVVVSPGNAGTRAAPRGYEGKTLSNHSGDPESLASALGVDLVVVGPEAPLTDGLVDRLEASGIVAFGPSQQAARLEGSKAFMKAFCTRHAIPTAPYRLVRQESELEQALADFPEAPVVKADGLCAGKGVVVAETHEEARVAATSMLRGEAFGEAGRLVVLEQRLQGAEVSVHAIADGTRAVMLPAAQDHKRIGENDSGPNTGGMGAYAPAPILPPGLQSRVEREIIRKVIDGMAAEGNPFKGTLFAGLMITPEGEPLLLEINVRFGDPETQVLVNLIEGDLFEILDDAARGSLKPERVGVRAEHALCVVLAAEGYPANPTSGDAITGLGEAEGMANVRIYHAGTRAHEGAVVTAGGRVLGVTGLGSTLESARDAAYAACNRIHFRGRQLRRDIGHRALGK